MPQNPKLLNTFGEPLENPDQYRRFIGKFIYLTIFRLDITYNVQVLNQFMTSLTIEHLKVVLHVLRYLKSAPAKGT